MFRGQIVTFNVNYSYVVNILYWFEPEMVKSCTGSAIRLDVILSAAHCVVDKVEDEIVVENLRVMVLGPHAELTMVGAKKALVHPGFTPYIRNDLSMIGTSENLLVFPINVAPELSWTMNRNDEADDISPIMSVTLCISLGYGMRYPPTFNAMRKGKLEPSLSKMFVPLNPIVSKEICNQLKGLNESKTTLCFFYEGHRSPCTGDSGGPIVCNGSLMGVLSRGLVEGKLKNGCGTRSAVSIYEDIGHYTSWIETTAALISSGNAINPWTILSWKIFIPMCFHLLGTALL